jgi:hypothetical protein
VEGCSKCGRSYADAIKVTSSNQQAMKFLGSGSRSSCSTCGRADLIEATAMSTIPTSVRKQWAIARKPPTTRSIETQADPEPMEQATQTTKHVKTQTIEQQEKAVQPFKETETQTVEIQSEAQREAQAEAQYLFTTLAEMVEEIVVRAPAHNYGIEWREAVEKFQFMKQKMAESGYPMKLEPPRRLRSHEVRGRDVRR